MPAGACRARADGFSRLFSDTERSFYRVRAIVASSRVRDAACTSPDRNEKRSSSPIPFCHVHASSVFGFGRPSSRTALLCACGAAWRAALHRKTKKRFRYYRVCTRGGIMYAHSRGVLRTSRKTHRAVRRCIIRALAGCTKPRTCLREYGFLRRSILPSRPREACNFRTVLACSPCARRVRRSALLANNNKRTRGRCMVVISPVIITIIIVVGRLVRWWLAAGR